MTRRVRPRHGLSLTEVLVAMFIMAAGMISIFTLFPLGAMQVGQALRDDRVSQTALQADAYMRDLWRSQVAARVRNDEPVNEPFYHAMNDPNQWVLPPATVSTNNMQRTAQLDRHREPDPSTNPPPPYTYQRGAVFLSPTFQLPNGNDAPATANSVLISRTMLSRDQTAAGSTSPTYGVNTASTYRNSTSGAGPTRESGRTFPSYPVLVDPLGYLPRVNEYQPWVARLTPVASGPAASRGQLLLPRRQLNSVGSESGPGPAASAARALRISGMTDDVLFTENGSPPPLATGEMTRQGRYTWAAVVQRPDVSKPDATLPALSGAEVRDVADLTILVFDGRSRLPAISPLTTSLNPAYNDEFVTAPLTVANASERTVSVDLPTRGPDDPVLVRAGGWMMDGTISGRVDTQAAVRGSDRRAHFYRIVSVTESTSATAGYTTMTLDLETPLVAGLEPAGTANPASQLYFFSGLVQVFRRPQLRPDFDH